MLQADKVNMSTPQHFLITRDTVTPGLPHPVSRHPDGRCVRVPLLPRPGRGGRDDCGRREAAGGRGAGRGQAEQDKHYGQQVIC